MSRLCVWRTCTHTVLPGVGGRCTHMVGRGYHILRTQHTIKNPRTMLAIDPAPKPSSPPSTSDVAALSCGTVAVTRFLASGIVAVLPAPSVEAPVNAPVTRLLLSGVVAVVLSIVAPVGRVDVSPAGSSAALPLHGDTMDKNKGHTDESCWHEETCVNYTQASQG